MTSNGRCRISWNILSDFASLVCPDVLLLLQTHTQSLYQLTNYLYRSNWQTTDTMPYIDINYFYWYSVTYSQYWEQFQIKLYRYKFRFILHTRYNFCLMRHFYKIHFQFNVQYQNGRSKWHYLIALVKISTKWFWIFKHMDGQVERPPQLYTHLFTLYKRTHKNSVTILLPNILLWTDKLIKCTQTSTDNQPY